MYNLPIKVSYIKPGAILTASGSVVTGSRNILVNSFLYDGDVLTTSCSYQPTESLVIGYSLNAMTTGSWIKDLDVYIRKPTSKRIDVISVTGSNFWSGSLANRFIGINNRSKST